MALKRILSTTVLSATRKRFSGTVTRSYRFWTKQYFHEWRKIFYPDGRKKIPVAIISVFCPLLLAVWFMDDGYLRKKDAVAIATDRFSEESIRKLAEGLYERYGIHATVVKRGRLYFGVEATRRFLSLISPYVISAMRYKFP